MSFAKQYYDQLNEIRTVTMRSESDINRLGANYRKLAREMKVSATEIATAAVTYYRQGLPDEQVNERLVGTIQYAKVSAMEFGKASEIITSATNAMEISARRASDVMIYLGDAAGTSADEVGTAMQRSTAAAEAFGLSFEW